MNLSKIYVQFLRFTCCLNMEFNLIILKVSPELFASQYVESAETHTKSLRRCSRKHRGLIYRDEVMTSKILQSPFCFKKYSAKKESDTFIFQGCFQSDFNWNQVKHARIMTARSFPLHYHLPVLRQMFKYRVRLPCVEKASSGPGKC